MAYIGNKPTNVPLSSADLPDNIVTSAKIADDAVDSDQLASGAVDSDQLASGAVDDAHLATGISSSKLSGTLPALNASSLTNLDARDLENALPAISGASLTGVAPSVATTTGQYDGTTTGTITVSGLSFAPKVLWCLYGVANTSFWSIGFAANGGTPENLCMFDIHAINSDKWNSDGGYFARASFPSDNYSNLDVNSWDSGGVTITKSKTNSGSGSTVTYKILLIG